MNRTVIAAATLLLAVPATAPAFAQSQQGLLDARYDRALAAGYKALMLCSAIANAEANGTTRTPESVARWELAGIQAPLDAIVSDLPYEIVRGSEGKVAFVEVQWSDDMHPRTAIASAAGGCAITPIGSAAVDQGKQDLAIQHPASGHEARPQVDPMAANPGARRVDVGAAFTGVYGSGRTNVVTVLYQGQLVGEQYLDGFFANTPQRTWSVAKSIAATLIGAAVHRGDADSNGSAGLGESDNDPRRAITIDNLLRMASGRYSDTPGNRTDPLYWGGATVEEVALDWPLITAPGSIYRYANNDTLAAVAAIKPSFAAHPPAEFFAKLGMNHTVAETDWAGDYILSSQVWTTSRDLAKFGQLYLNDGKLPSGERVLPEGWVQYVSAPSGPQPDGPFGYGAGFWLLNKSEGVPADAFAAFGNRGQYVVIVPSRKVVIVRRGEDPVGSSFDIAAFTRDVLAALPDE